MRPRRPRLPPAPEALGNGRYTIGESVGHGAMATVYRAVDGYNKDSVAIKVLNRDKTGGAKRRTRFLDEARTMAALDHPNIVRIRDVGHDEGYDWFVMELVEGGTLATELQRHGRPDPTVALDWVFQVLQGLDYAHAAGVVHRDVKPHNMLLGADGVVKLTDFGIARVMARTSSRITAIGDTLGTLAYMAPEQRVDPRIAGPAVDVYGAGATLYLLFTGRRPFDLAMATMDPTVFERLPPNVRPLVRRSTAYRPEDRYQNARAMAVAVAQAWHDIDPDAVVPYDRMEMFDSLDDSETIVRFSEDLGPEV